MDRSAPTELNSSAGKSSNLASIPRSTFRVFIVESLRSAILSGEIPPGAPVVETTLSEQFGVSRGPLREAMRQLVEEGLLVTVPYTGTHVISLSVDDVREIYSMRTALETFAFEYIWEKRSDAFVSELCRRHELLTEAIDAGNDHESIKAELNLHGFVYEASGHNLLLRTWTSLRGRLQLYWAQHHRAHGLRGPLRDSHDSYVKLATESDLNAMRNEIQTHMLRGATQTEEFIRRRMTAEDSHIPEATEGR